MDLQRERWKRSLGKDRDDSDRVPDLRIAQQGAVEAQRLTGDPHWDVYLQVLQGRVDTVRKVLESHELRLADPDIVEYADIIATKAQVARSKAEIAALEFAMQVPVDLIKNGTDAAAALKAHEERMSVDGG